ncbi:glycine cleavage system aminomethyltransferase GcvT [Prochlorococcus sp. MIT 1307]|uniref:glycine cleavage system aminomethyltransferase GcvT n=1 Tax=Prochlorococcus sp. MIT 1307 TaxID=3096219 RepID=UPI002A75BAE0|nr:glycine cleavage system aminomethyltransferase GcvT [Prochlorococcus sp. MIT 1307]
MELKRTPLYEQSLKEGCRIMPFAGWEMPIQFSGLIKEHEAVRNEAGLFDISHMGILRLEGQNPKDALQSLVPSDLNRIGPGEACYTVLLNEKGGIIDDLIIYDLGNNNNQGSLLIVINAASSDADIAWLEKYLQPANIQISDEKKDGVLIALQGPKSQKILEEYLNQSLSNLPRFGHTKIQFEGISKSKYCSIFLARTGYTGEDGFELLMSADAGQIFWKDLINKGIQPCGLGARDTLRLEAGMHLYGNDMDTKTTPFEAGLGWIVHLEMPTKFIGRDVLEQQAKDGVRQRLVALELEGRAIARKGYQVFDDGISIGKITSGTWSPTLNKAIALAYVPIEHSKIGSKLLIEVRKQQYPAKIVKKPFYRCG